MTTITNTQQFLEQEPKENFFSKYTWRDVLLVLMILVIIFLAWYVLHWTGSEGFKCINSPLVYGVQHFQASANGIKNIPITCSCTAIGIEGGFIVTNNSMKPMEKFYSEDYVVPTYNFTFVKGGN